MGNFREGRSPQAPCGQVPDSLARGWRPALGRVRLRRAGWLSSGGRLSTPPPRSVRLRLARLDPAPSTRSRPTRARDPERPACLTPRSTSAPPPSPPPPQPGPALPDCASATPGAFYDSSESERAGPSRPLTAVCLRMCGPRPAPLRPSPSSLHWLWRNCWPSGTKLKIRWLGSLSSVISGSTVLQHDSAYILVAFFLTKNYFSLLTALVVPLNQ